MNATTSPTTRLELRVVIVLWDGTKYDERFATCEEAWMFQRKVSHKHANRKKKAERVETQYSFYCGCTITEETFGGWLVGGKKSDHCNELEYAKSQEYHDVRRFKAANGL